MTRLRLALALAALAVGGLVVIAEHSQAALPLGCGPRLHGWEVIPGPPFPPQDPTHAVTSFTVDPTVVNHVEATDGTSLFESFGGGCTWGTDFTLPSTPSPNQQMSAATSRITQVLMVGRAGRFPTYLTVADEGARPHVLGADGSYVTVLDNGLPATGTPVTLVAAPTDPQDLYLAISPPQPSLTGPLPATNAGILYATFNGGKSWSLRSSVSAVAAAGAHNFSQLAVDPRNPMTVWAIAGGVLYRSVDGGATFSAAPLPAGEQQSLGWDFTAIDIEPSGTVVAASDGSNGPQLVRVSGAATRKSPAPAGVRSIAHLPNGELALSTVTGHVYFLDRSTGRPADVSPVVGQGDPGVRADATTYPTFWAHGATKVFHYIGHYGAVEVLPPGTANLVPPTIRPPAGVTVTPLDPLLSIPQGQRRTVTYTLRVPRVPTALDVYFLVDISTSMESVQDDLRHEFINVANQLAKDGINVWAGVGAIGQEQQDNPQFEAAQALAETDPASDPHHDNPPLYQRYLPLSPVGPALTAALDRLTTNSVGEDANLVAIDQAATGAGFQVLYKGLPLYRIPPDLDAHFRTNGALRVIFFAQDTGAQTVEGQPSFGAVVRDLRQRQTLFVADNASGGDQAVQAWDAAMARATGAVSANTFACGGDSTTVIRPGQPLVCDNTVGVSRMLGELLASIADVRPVQLLPQASPVLRGNALTPPRFPVNLKATSAHQFSVTYSCVHVPTGMYLPRIAVVMRGIQIATAGADVRCGPRMVLPPARPAAAPPPPPLPVHGPVAPVGAVFAPAPQAPAQAETQPYSQAGMAEEEQAQPRVAVAALDAHEEVNVSPIDAARPGDSPTELAAVGVGAAVLMAGCAGVLLAQRRRQALAPAAIRRIR